MIPNTIIRTIEAKLDDIHFGSLTVKIIKHDGRKTRYLITEETSIVVDSPSSGEGGHCDTRNYDAASQKMGEKHE